ncbi:transcriptional regulator [Flavobacterium branchiophilum]|uniref:Transcriptional regulator n=1 Tax=Flavobacterium branchiophilum TaxID=55197 RepID=A0A543G1T1_9FLAO|nr:helix-turn-helix transcriptional regulator [Flavobacterium branchiophilum]OXA72301.1 transcriptional regulator [Flavobacterium branchiophilum] [Flavobacterium branchiophilum NBRC 15030 = ATCC 35035]TQM39984.1 transcriptional regulator [Flavobacterium branchiophilum]GEM56590.1 transcriptional regulator [Flavobacterium branchiophilum NBRC 15030 = ATCC 35035]
MRYTINKQPTEVLLEIAKRQVKMRKSKRFTQQEVATRAGVSLGSLKRFETTGQISLESLLKLAHFFDCLTDFDLLFYREDTSEIEKLFSKK